MKSNALESLEFEEFLRSTLEVPCVELFTFRFDAIELFQLLLPAEFEAMKAAFYAEYMHKDGPIPLSKKHHLRLV